MRRAASLDLPEVFFPCWKTALLRHGRGMDGAVAVLVASANPLDQFLAHHPDYFLGRSPENALINPDHLLILLSHLRCAMFELPFAKDEGYGALPAERLREFLDFLVESNEAHTTADKYFWMSDAYPAANICMRFRLKAMATSFHSPLTASSPRSENWRNPNTCLMIPKTGSTVDLRLA